MIEGQRLTSYFPSAYLSGGLYTMFFPLALKLSIDKFSGLFNIPKTDIYLGLTTPVPQTPLFEGVKPEGSYRVMASDGWVFVHSEQAGVLCAFINGYDAKYGQGAFERMDRKFTDYMIQRAGITRQMRRKTRLPDSTRKLLEEADAAIALFKTPKRPKLSLEARIEGKKA